jgi:proteasome lid subunit RPN8/RPN11
MTALHLSSSLFKQIEEQGRAAYPNECCGIMYGVDTPATGRVVRRLEPAGNAFDADEQYHRFSISPKQLMAAERTAADAGLLVLGFYHSHPDHSARPSEYDREHAWPFYSYVIVAIAKGTPQVTTSWRLNDQSEAFEEESITIDDPASQAAVSRNASKEVSP